MSRKKKSQFELNLTSASIDLNSIWLWHQSNLIFFLTPSVFISSWLTLNNLSDIKLHVELERVEVLAGKTTIDAHKIEVAGYKLGWAHRYFISHPYQLRERAGLNLRQEPRDARTSGRGQGQPTLRNPKHTPDIKIVHLILVTNQRTEVPVNLRRLNLNVARG